MLLEYYLLFVVVQQRLSLEYSKLSISRTNGWVSVHDKSKLQLIQNTVYKKRQWKA